MAKNIVKKYLLVISCFSMNTCLSQQPRIAIVTSRFNSAVAQVLYDDAQAHFRENEI